ncbi:21 kDa protein [Vitis vinifera]|uniref:21 kDa protein n=1 Tax=Vitis vinifera TaxID=29760 RepID=A0A438IRX4_VITVI|nr:21 kDa protein [Vitis vinifera]
MEGSFFSSHFLPALLIFLSLTSYINLSSAARPAADKASTEFIRTSCGTTTYPRLCYTSLSAHASVIQTSPKLSSRHSPCCDPFNRTIYIIPDVKDGAKSASKSNGGDDPNKRLQFGLMMDDIQTWVSTALTDEDTCTDGFAGNAMNGNLKTTVRARIVNMAHMTSNALGLINSYASLHN